MTLEVGRVCLKIAGREAGRYCVILNKIDDTFVLITGPKVLTGVKRRRCNVEHLEPTPYTLKIKAEASESAVIKAYDEAGLLKKFGLKKPSPELVKEAEKPKKKEAKPEKAKEKEKPKKEKAIEKKKEKAKEKKGITIKLKIPTLGKKEKKKKKKKKKKPKKTEAKPKKKVKEKKPKKTKKKAKK